MMWLWFFVGQAVNVLRQAKLIAGSRPEVNPLNSMGKWMYRNLIGLLVREVGAITAWLLLTHPKTGPVMIGKLWGGYEHLTSVFIEIPFLACPFGIVFSLMFDMAIEKWPWLKSHIPALGNGLDGNGK